MAKNKWVWVLGIIAVLLLIFNSALLILFLKERREARLSPPNQLAEESVGVQAGKAVREWKTQSQSTYQALSQQAQKTQAELAKTGAEAARVFNEQAQKAMQDFEASASQILEALRAEIQKFEQTLQDSKTQR